MNTKSITSISKYLILGLLIFITACSRLFVVPPTSGAALPTQETNPIYTAAVRTIQAQTPTQAAATATPVPSTATQTVFAQPTGTSAPAVTECQDAAQYITDDGLDGTTYAPNTTFTKTWTLKNTGSCTWDDRYLVSQISGTYMTQSPGYLFIPQGQTVAPGQTVNISVGMTSPVENGSYRSDWGLQKRDGPLMPIQSGANGNAFYVKIRVNDGSSTTAGKLTVASINIEREEGSGAVCTADATYFVHASMTTDGPATISYEILSSAGQISAGNFESSNHALSPSVPGTAVFNQAGTKTINVRFVGPYPHPDDITVMLRVIGGEFYNAKLSCQ